MTCLLDMPIAGMTSYFIANITMRLEVWRNMDKKKTCAFKTKDDISSPLRARLKGQVPNHLLHFNKRWEVDLFVIPKT